MTVYKLRPRGCLKIESALLLEMQPVAMSRPREGMVHTQWSSLRALPKTDAFRVSLEGCSTSRCDRRPTLSRPAFQNANSTCQLSKAGAAYRYPLNQAADG